MPGRVMNTLTSCKSPPNGLKLESKFYSLATSEVLQWKIKYLVTICSSVLRRSPNTSAKMRARPFTSCKRNSFQRLSYQGVQSGGRASLRCRSTLSGSSRAGVGDGHGQAATPKNRGRRNNVPLMVLYNG